ncbi:MAG: hypothetical protein JXA10_14185, partial [Anaerolineae bacterium]|nr:hypothetical protein [Anaerolineae bacterium]
MRGGSAYTWVFFLVFGWSIAIGIAEFLATQLGFPYTWTTPLAVVMMGAVLFLVYRGYSVHAWLLAACLAFILIAGVAVLRAVTVSEPNIPDMYLTEFETNADRASEFWDYGYGMDFTVEYDAERTSYLIWSYAYGGVDYPTPLVVEFPPFTAAGGQWAFVSGSLRLRGAVAGTFTASPEDQTRRLDTVLFEADSEQMITKPIMQLQVPLPGTDTRDPVRATATMEIAYALADGSTETTTLTRDFEIIVASLDYYYTYYDRYQNWENSRRVTNPSLLIALAVGSVIAAGASIYLWRTGDLRAGANASGLQMVIRRLSGAQQLGAEV